MVHFRYKGDLRKTTQFLNKLKRRSYLGSLDRYGAEGVRALASATPTDSGETASAWGYEIVQNKESAAIYWTNSHINNGVNIAVILQYGHGTGTGGYVEGVDYINPAIRPIFDQIAESAWKEVTSS